MTRIFFVQFLQFLVKSNGVNIQSPGWEKSQEKIENVVKITLELSQGLKSSYCSYYSSLAGKMGNFDKLFIYVSYCIHFFMSFK